MKIVVVGGGFAGVKTALELSNKPGFEVQLISQSPNFEYHGALYRSGTGRSPLEVVLPLRDIFKQSRNVEVVLERAESVNPLKQMVVSESGKSYHYDKLVLAMGNVLNYFGVKGMKEHSYSLDTITNTISLRYRLTLLFKAGKAVSIAVIGAGASGVELAGELNHFAGLVATRYGCKPSKLDIRLIEGADRILPALSEQVSEKAQKRLEKLGVKVMLRTRVNSCEPGKLCIDSGELDVDLIVWTAGSRAVEFYANQPRVFELDRGKVKVDQFLAAKGHTDIYVLGDNAATPHAGMAQTALHDAKFVASNFLREAAHKEALPYRVLQPIYVVPIGPRWAILQSPTNVISGYRAWLLRRRADLAIYRNFQPYKMAMKTWRKGRKLAKF